jgi:hypothetical protein
MTDRSASDKPPAVPHLVVLPGSRLSQRELVLKSLIMVPEPDDRPRAA